MNTNCKKCDRPECEVLPLQRAVQAYLMAPEDDPQVAADLDSRVYGATHACRLARVDWRDRCLAAEAELAKLREGLPKWQVHSNGDAVLSSAKDNGGAMIGFVEPMLGYWRAFLDKECTLGRAVTPESARRLVEQHHGLPVCEVLP